MKKTFAALALALGVAPLALAAPVSYTVDPNHTFPSFEADHMGISFWRGMFTRSSGKVVLDKEAGSGSVDIAVDATSIEFGQKQLDAWAQGDQFFDVKRTGKEARYKGRLAGFADGAPTRVDGELTLHGVTRPLSLRLNRFKCVPHPMLKRELCGADASATFDRAAFGLTAGKDYGFSMDVVLRIQVEAIADQ